MTTALVVVMKGTAFVQNQFALLLEYADCTAVARLVEHSVGKHRPQCLEHPVVWRDGRCGHLAGFPPGCTRGHLIWNGWK